MLSWSVVKISVKGSVDVGPMVGFSVVVSNADVFTVTVKYFEGTQERNV